MGVLGPLTAERYLGGARAWSVIVAAQALGTIAGAGLAARVRVRRPILVAVLATFPAAVPIALLAVRAPVWLIAVAMFTAGISNDVFGVLWATTIHREIPEESLSRVSSYDGFGSWPSPRWACSSRARSRRPSAWATPSRAARP